MASRTEQPNLSRRRMLQAAAVVPAAAVIPTLALGSPAQALYRGEMSRKRVMARARDWYDRGIQYNMGGTASDRDGNHWYRRDCSGFVSMCLHSQTPGHSTRTLHNIADRISWKNLKPGDFLNSYDNHCMLFDSWSVKDGWLWMYDLATPALDMRHKRVDANALQNQNYKPYRYVHIHDS